MSGPPGPGRASCSCPHDSASADVCRHLAGASFRTPRGVRRAWISTWEVTSLLDHGRAAGHRQGRSVQAGLAGRGPSPLTCTVPKPLPRMVIRPTRPSASRSRAESPSSSTHSG
ncbi:SWIM zinc finger family protein [Streptomyces albus]|uniref:SWIM zinc finger family protein n=1 Tax=Streptomyces albus TaxID=1888 RepID=A0A8H1QKG0_9ACTN|nr:SWIM zinc finger family protein [Streptomyces albus]